MKNKSFLAALFFTIFTFTANAQSNGFFTVHDTAKVVQVKTITSGGCITLSDGGWGANKVVYITKWDNNFNVVWKQKLSGCITGFITEANDGNYYLLTRMGSTFSEIVVVKISAVGQIVWSKKMSTLANADLNTFCLQKAVPGDNGFLIGTGDCSISNSLLKFDANGNFQWGKRYGYSAAVGVGTLKSIENNGNGYVIVSGFNSNRCLLASIDNQGVILSYKIYQATTTFFIPAKFYKVPNGFVLLNSYNGSINNRLGVSYFDANLNLVSFREYIYNGTYMNVYGSYLNGSSSPELLISGDVQVPVSNWTEPNGLLMSIDLNSGNINWKHRMRAVSIVNGPRNNWLFDVAIWGNKLLITGGNNLTTGNNFGNGGYFGITDLNGTGICNPLTVDISMTAASLSTITGVYSTTTLTALSTSITIAPSNKDNYTMKSMCGALPVSTTNLNSIAADSGIINIFPNPTSGFLNIELGSLIGNAELTIFNTLGQIVKQEKLSNQSTALNINNLEKGVYFIQLVSDNNTISTHKIMKQ